ncbi:hypothetical protein B0I08_101618 [Glaciihabitans tibetensis]|uniref:Uncharacterized protein n=1 Tax=Glaciihabitans tibetensis TaxID=1266600 RepID=A0A2T0VJU4_9MICO|nr:hypothetical protein B0I08_101618 [Glaciihabitans tibetensis]
MAAHVELVGVDLNVTHVVRATRARKDFDVIRRSFVRNSGAFGGAALLLGADVSVVGVCITHAPTLKPESGAVEG